MQHVPETNGDCMSLSEHNLKLRSEANSLAYSCTGAKCTDYVLLYTDDRDVFICYDHCFVCLRVRPGRGRIRNNHPS